MIGDPKIISQERLTVLPDSALDRVPTCDVLGVRFHCLRIPDVIDHITRYVVQRTPRQICLVNAYSMTLAQRDDHLRQLFNQSDLVLADGMSIKWGGRWIGAAIPERVAGPDLATALCDMASSKGYRIFLLGSTDETLGKLTYVLKSQWPQIQIAGTYSPPFCDRLAIDETDKIRRLLKSCQVDILLVSMSAPKQEKWIAENLQSLGVPVSIGIGAAFDFLSGEIPRAPMWLQTSGLEWAYRLYREPRRLWKRYLLGNLVFLSLLAVKAMKNRLPKRSGAGRRPPSHG